MLDLLHIAFAILNFLTMWRFLAPVALAASIPFVMFKMDVDGRVVGGSAWILVIIGVLIGIVWQYRHARRELEMAILSL